MKASINTGLLIGLIFVQNIAHAIELPDTLEKNLADAVIERIENYKDSFMEEGIISILVNYQWHGNQKIEPMGLQIAAPLFSKTIGNRSLCRLEYHYLSINDTNQLTELEDSQANLEDSQMSFNSKQSKESPKLSIHKLGIAGRHILNPNFILGGYLFGDRAYTDSSVGKTERVQRIQWMVNPGIELIWPQHGRTITFDGICNPSNLFEKHNQRFYKGSIKLSKLRPQVLDIFFALSFEKYPFYDSTQYTGSLGIKGQVPIKWKGLNKHFTAGIAGTFTKKEKTWINYGNIGISLYWQIHAVALDPQNSLRDYLRMPIDRHVAVPRHPGQQSAMNDSGEINMEDNDSDDCLTDDEDCQEGIRTPPRGIPKMPSMAELTPRAQPSKESLRAQASKDRLHSRSKSRLNRNNS